MQARLDSVYHQHQAVGLKDEGSVLEEIASSDNYQVVKALITLKLKVNFNLLGNMLCITDG